MADVLAQVRLNLKDSAGSKARGIDFQKLWGQSARVQAYSKSQVAASHGYVSGGVDAGVRAARPVVVKECASAKAPADYRKLVHSECARQLLTDAAYIHTDGQVGTTDPGEAYGPASAKEKRVLEFLQRTGGDMARVGTLQALADDADMADQMCESGTVTSSPTRTDTSTPTATSSLSETLPDDASFSVLPPRTWTLIDSAAASDAAVAVKAPEVQDGVRTNFNVVVQTVTPPPELRDMISQAKAAWKQQGVQVTDKPDRTIGNQPAKGYTFTRTSQGTKFTQTQYFVVRNSKLYSLTMTSAATGNAVADADRTLNTILSTWTWR